MKLIQLLEKCGTTSACAENTPLLIIPPTKHRNYLRVCGEYGMWKPCDRKEKELPPRVRRIRGTAGE